ncbi:MAG: hypothetical protein ACKOHG_06535 [Planctomycetia bacterium]
MAGMSNQLPFIVAAARRVLPAVAVTICLAAAAEALGCPNCKDAVNTSDPEGLNVARGYFYSILIMLAMPATLIGSFSVYVWREMQRQKQALAKAAAEIVSPPALPITPPHP